MQDIKYHQISLDDQNNFYTRINDKIERINNSDVYNLNYFEFFKKGIYQHFFKTPFNSISYIIENRVLKTFNAHPSSFYPGSPFDVFQAIKDYLQYNILYFPRFYLYPSSVCNSKCPICQFNFRRESSTFIEYPIIINTIDEILKNNPSKSLSVVISGDGEPALHPHFNDMLKYLHKNNIRIFLTSNWILNNNRESIIECVAENCSMITISIKGLNEKAYIKYQGLEDKDKYHQVLSNLERLMKSLNEKRRRDDVLVGIASLILPENAKSYLDMLDYFISLGIDYVYLNPVEPSYNHWNITFTQEEKQNTYKTIDRLNKYYNCGTFIRYPKDPFLSKNYNSVYYDANNRYVKKICGSALWNPILIPSKNGAKLLSCRSSEKFNDQNFWYSKDISNFSIANDLNAELINKVMEATKNCSECRLERQVRLFDIMISLELENNFKGFFVLNFDVENLKNNNSVISFEDTI